MTPFSNKSPTNSLNLPLSLSLAAFFIFPLFSSYRLSYFIPLIIISFYQRPLHTSLWISFGCGLLLDLLSSHRPLGFHAICYTLTSLLLYNRKQQFFEEHISTLSLFTIIYASINTLIQFLALSSIQQAFPLSGKWILYDLIFMPLIDGLYAFICFMIPIFLMGRKISTKTTFTLKRPQ